MSDIEKILEFADDNFKKKIEESLQERIIESIKWNFTNEIEKVAGDFFNEEVRPKVVADLHGKKELIISEVLESLSQIGTKVGEKLVEKATHNMDNSWNVSKLVDGLFK